MCVVCCVVHVCVCCVCMCICDCCVCACVCVPVRLVVCFHTAACPQTQLLDDYPAESGEENGKRVIPFLPGESAVVCLEFIPHFS